jgi:hypothetical protein
MIESELKDSSENWPPISQITIDGNPKNKLMHLNEKSEMQTKRESMFDVFKKKNKIHTLNDNSSFERQETKF